MIGVIKITTMCDACLHHEVCKKHEIQTEIVEMINSHPGYPIASIAESNNIQISISCGDFKIWC